MTKTLTITMYQQTGEEPDVYVVVFSKARTLTRTNPKTHFIPTVTERHSPFLPEPGRPSLVTDPPDNSRATFNGAPTPLALLY